MFKLIKKYSLIYLIIVAFYLYHIGFSIRLDLVVPLLSSYIAIIFPIFIENKVKRKFSHKVSQVLISLLILAIFFLCIFIAKLLIPYHQ